MSIDKFEYDLIMNQTGINDKNLIEKIYFEYKSDTVKTILKLLEIELPVRTEKIRNVFDDFREILDEKDTIFQEFLTKQNKST